MRSGKSLEEILRAHRILICVGSGGVGKTTLSAALGIKAAQIGLKVLVMTIDPSKRLKVALGITEEPGKIVKLVQTNYQGELSAAILDAQTIFNDFIRGSAESVALANELLSNKLYQQLSTTLSGSQEFTALLQLSKIDNQDQYDLIVLDTPPAQHAIEFLEAPEKIGALFDDSIVRWFVGSSDVGIVRRIISTGTKTVLRALEGITGSRFIHELNHFFKSVKSVQDKIRDKTELVQNILRRESTGFLLITGFDEAKLREAEELNDFLDSKKYHMLGIVINKAFPKWVLNKRAPEDASIAAEYNKWVKYHRQRESIFNQFSSRWEKILPVVRIPDFNEDVYGLKGLEVVSNEVDSAFNSSDANRLLADFQKN